MRFVVLVHGEKEMENGAPPPRESVEAMMEYNEELAKAGVIELAEGLAPTSKGARATYSNGKWTVTDGPFPETKELIGGFWIWKVKSKEEALEWIRRMPNTGLNQPGRIELRKIMDEEDFGEFAPEVEALEERLREQAAKKQAQPS